jgi:hypothetical protein
LKRYVATMFAGELESVGAEEQEALIGKLMLQRGELLKQCALLQERLNQSAGSFQAIGSLLISNLGQRANEILRLIGEIAERGGLDAVRRDLGDLQSAQANLQRVQNTLHNAGISF